jgi:hypothetical protein
MTAAIPTTAVGVFRDRNKADRAVADLHRHGFGRDAVHISEDQEQTPPPPPVEGNRATEGGIAGAYAGGLLGALLGAAVGLVVHLTGAWGAHVVAGIGLGAVAGAILGATAGQWLGAWMRYRAEPGDSGAGRLLVEVKAGERYEEAVDVLRRSGARGKGSPLV